MTITDFGRAHKDAGKIRCEACLRLTSGYKYSERHGRICVWCYRNEQSGTCLRCHGEGYVEVQVGGDGYGGRCCALGDVEVDCPDCGGTGKAQPGGGEAA